MNRRKFLGAGAAIGVTPVVTAASASAPTSAAHRITDTLNRDFATSHICFHPVARADRNQVYLTLTTTGRDYFGRQKVGGGWHYDLDAQSWNQQKPWISPGTEKQFAKLIDKAQRALLAEL